MAKILLVSEKISPTAWQLALALRSQQHQVIFLTSYGENLDEAHDIEILSFFKKWNAFEVAQLFPALTSMAPDILHFVLEKDSVNQAHLMLWAYAQARQELVFTISLLYVRKNLNRRSWIKFLIQKADIVTCPSIDSLARLRGIHVKSPRQGRGLLPPVLGLSQDSDEFEKIEIEELLVDEKYIVRPFLESKFDPDSPYFQSLLRVLKTHKVVLFGSQDHWTLRERKRFQKWLADEGVEKNWFLTGQKTLNEIQTLLRNSEALWLADLDLSPTELTEYYLKTLETSATLILDPKQARLHAPLWRNSQNCWILGETTWDEMLKMDSLKLAYDFDTLKLNRQDLVDAPINELNRLYIKALSHKQNI